MPKKFKGENSKAAEARARIEEKKLQEKEKIKQEKEDELWRDDDKLINRKNQRKISFAVRKYEIKEDEMERKKQEALMRKMENKRVYEDEMSQLKGKPTTQMVNKVTHFSIANKKSSELEALNTKISTKLSNVIQPIELEENFNKSFSLDDQARNVDQALSLLNTSDGKVSDIDQHPERRMRAAFAAFESCHLERLKKENPHLRLSQVKQMLRKEWLKSPENPMNQHIQQANKARIMATEINGGENNINNGDHLIPSIMT